MKMKLALLIPLITILGCGTIGTGPSVNQTAVIAKSASYTATMLWVYGGFNGALKPHPADATKFLLAKDCLQGAIAGGTLTVTNLPSCLRSLPIKQLQGSDGTLLIGEAVILLDAYDNEVVNLNSTNAVSQFVVPVAQGVVDGIGMALSPQLKKNISRRGNGI